MSEIYDIIVCGGGSSGFIAAIAAKRKGAKVLLVEESSFVGGTNTLSLVNTLMTFHYQKELVIKGIPNRIIERLKKENGTIGHILDPLGFCSSITPVDIEVLKKVYLDLIIENDIELLLHTKIIGVKRKGKEIKAIQVVNADGISDIYGKIFIDATGNGDLSVFAEEEYLIGRVEDHLVQPMTMPFIIGGVDIKRLKKEMKKRPHNFIIRKDYDYKYIGISGFFKEVKKAKEQNIFNIERDRVLLFQNVKDHEVTVNMTRVLNKSPLVAKDLSAAEIEGRKQIYECFTFLKNHIKGFEKSFIAQTPQQIGIRESRHIIGEYLLTKDDVINQRRFYDAICVSAFPMDIHSPTNSDLATSKDSFNNTVFEIPLRAILPKINNNLILTGRIISADHYACASLRVTPVCMALGEVAGTLASLAIIYNQDVKDLDYSILKNELKLFGHRLNL